MRSAHLDHLLTVLKMSTRLSTFIQHEKINEFRMSLIGMTGNRYGRRRGGRYGSNSATMHVREMVEMISGKRQGGRKDLAPVYAI